MKKRLNDFFLPISVCTWAGALAIGASLTRNQTRIKNQDSYFVECQDGFIQSAKFKNRLTDDLLGEKTNLNLDRQILIDVDCYIDTSKWTKATFEVTLLPLAATSKISVRRAGAGCIQATKIYEFPLWKDRRLITVSLDCYISSDGSVYGVTGLTSAENE